jgi:tartrate-resistant acid phosphatase type 5
MHKWFFIFTLILFSQNISAQAPLVENLGYKGGSINGIKKINNATHFIAMGDWGRNGENYQKEVAAGMGKAAHDLDASFVVATGDNFYPYGVASTRDYHWISSFESIYTAQSLHVKWYPVLGNHDYASNPDAEVEYSLISSRWSMPSRYYSKSFNANDTSRSILMLFIDTDPIEKELNGQKHDSVKYKPGAVQKQKQWIEETLAQSNAKWKILVGHHPLYTGGWRKDSKNTVSMKNFLEPILDKYGVDVYLAGHEHHLEHTKPNNHRTHHIISGAASEARPTAIHPNGGLFAAATQGFATFSVSNDQIFIQFIEYTNKILHESIIRK